MKKITSLTVAFLSLFVIFFSPCYAIAGIQPTPTPTTNPNAQNTDSSVSSTWTTCIVDSSGSQNSKNCQPGQSEGTNPGNPSNPNPNKQVEAAEDLYHAFVDYSGNGGNSISYYDSATFKLFLSKYAIPQFTNNIDQAIANPNQGQLQCVGFVFMAVALYSGYWMTPAIPGPAAGALSYAGFQAGPKNYYKNVGSTIPQPGDIGVTDWGNPNGSGHILIVKQPDGTRSFIAIEGNFNEYGGVRDNPQPDPPYLDKDFVFFHLQSN